jgi:sulfhydrogenase subunit delta
MKPKVGFFDFTSCEGCQLTVLDSLQTHLELLELVEIVQFREAISERGEDYAIAFVEGSITRESDQTRLRAIRAQASVLVALGACAHLGGINAIKNLGSIEGAIRYVYGDQAQALSSHSARPLSAVVPIDAYVPGCPIDRAEFVAIVQALLNGKRPPIPDFPMCMDCKQRENVCLFDKGSVCLGPITRAGCGAICPTFGEGCVGCRGAVPHPNIESMLSVLAEHGMKPDEIRNRLSMFGAYEMAKS